MAVTARTPLARAIALGLSVLAATAYCIVVAPAFREDWAREQYLIVAAIHTPLLCWAALGVMAGAGSNAADRFAFLFKSIEVAIVAGLYLAAGMAFGGITVGMFEALSIDLPEVLLRLIAAIDHHLDAPAAALDAYRAGHLRTGDPVQFQSTL